MSIEEATYVLEHEDPYSTNAIAALKFHAQKDRVANQERAIEQWMQLDTELLGIDTFIFGKPPRSGPWPEEEFQALLRKQAKLKNAQPVN